MVFCRNVQLMPTLFLKLTKIRQRENSKFVDFIYEIDIMSNFNFKFCNCASLFSCDVTFRRIILKFTGKNWKLNSIKLIRKCIDVHDR